MHLQRWLCGCNIAQKVAHELLLINTVCHSFEAHLFAVGNSNMKHNSPPGFSEMTLYYIRVLLIGCSLATKSIFSIQTHIDAQSKAVTRAKNKGANQRINFKWRRTYWGSLWLNNSAARKVQCEAFKLA